MNVIVHWCRQHWFCQRKPRQKSTKNRVNKVFLLPALFWLIGQWNWSVLQINLLSLFQQTFFPNLLFWKILFIIFDSFQERCQISNNKKIYVLLKIIIQRFSCWSYPYCYQYKPIVDIALSQITFEINNFNKRFYNVVHSVPLFWS